ELVDLVGELGGDLRLRLGPAEDQQPVEGPQGLLARSGRAGGGTAGPTVAAVATGTGTGDRPGAGQRLDEHRAGPDQAGVGEVEDRPQVAEAVLHRRTGEGQPAAGRDAAQLLGRVAGRVLDRLGLVDDEPGPVDLGQLLDVADGRG